MALRLLQKSPLLLLHRQAQTLPLMVMVPRPQLTPLWMEIKEQLPPMRVWRTLPTADAAFRLSLPRALLVASRRNAATQRTLS